MPVALWVTYLLCVAAFVVCGMVLICAGNEHEDNRRERRAGLLMLVSAPVWPLTFIIWLGRHVVRALAHELRDWRAGNDDDKRGY